MFKELIDKLKAMKKQLIKNDEFIEEQIDLKINLSIENNIYKVKIDDYISINDYIKTMKSNEQFHILDLICNCVLWNSSKQKVNKGVYYIILIDNRIYNILFTYDKIKIDERINKEKIIEERCINYYINNKEYTYYSAKHDETGNTFYTKYYNKNRLYSFKALDLSEQETYDEISSIIYNLENIYGIENILNLEELKEYILNDLGKNILQTKKLVK